MNLLQPQASSSTTPANDSYGIVLSVNPSRSVFSNESWIVDSGASAHIACSLQFFTSYKLVNNKSVTLPNKTAVPINAIGTVTLARDLVLHNVLYIPHFTFNLLSVSALLTDNFLSVTFFKTYFLIQEVHSSKKIGKGDLLEGLYVLTFKDIFSNTHFTQCNTSHIPLHRSALHSVVTQVSHSAYNNATLWHSRFGHTSDKVLKN